MHCFNQFRSIVTCKEARSDTLHTGIILKSAKESKPECEGLCTETECDAMCTETKCEALCKQERNRCAGWSYNHDLHDCDLFSVINSTQLDIGFSSGLCKGKTDELIFCSR